MNDPINTDPNAPLDAGDEAAFAALRDLYNALDPAPDLVAGVLFAIDLDGVDAELAAISDRFVATTGARGPEGTRTITFGSTNLTVTIALPGTNGRHLDGWLEPAGCLRIELVTPDCRLETRSDEGGRFAFDAVPTGQVHLEIHPDPGGSVPLPRRVVTQPVVL